MRNKKTGKPTAKHCPFIDEKCIKEDCEIFNDKLNRCDLGLLPYNIYLLSKQLQEGNLSLE